MSKKKLNNHFSGLIFPEHLSLGAIGGPVFMTEIIATSNGYEQRNTSWNQARYRYDLHPNINCKTDYDDISAFFRIHKGRALSFAFKDWSDYQALNQQIGVGDGVMSTWQLIKVYNFMDHSDARVIKLPIRESLQITLTDEAGEREHIDYTVDCQTGVITFDSPPPPRTKIVANFDFYIPVQFDHDELPVASVDALDIQMHLKLLEVRI